MDHLRWRIRSKHKRLVPEKSGIEDMKELLLGSLACAEELEIIEEEKIDGSKGIAEGVRLAGSYRGSVAIYELLGGEDDRGVTFTVGLMANGVEEMCLAEAGRATE